jgi:hypothetical protein
VPTHPLSPLVGGDLSIQAINWVLEHSQSRLGARHVLLSIANHAKADGTGAWPSVATIAHESNLCEREVQYALRELEGIGELKTRRGVGRSSTSLYSLPKMAQTLHPTPQEKVQVATQKVQSTTEKVHKVAPEPSLKQPSLESTVKNGTYKNFNFDETQTLRCKTCNGVVTNSRAAMKHHVCREDARAAAVRREIQVGEWRR